MKKILLYIIFFTLLCWGGNYSIDYTIGKQLANRSPYYLSFASIGVNSLTSNLDAWVKIKTNSSKAELEAYLARISASLDVPLIREKIVYTEDSGVKTILYRTASKGQKISLVLESDEEETSIVVSITGKGDAVLLKNYESKLEQIDLDWTYYYTYRGHIGQIIAYDAQTELIKVMLKNLKAREISWYKNGKVTSCAAYSPVLTPFTPSVSLEGKKYNLQIAVQVDEKKNKTYIIIGSPLILGEY